MSRGSHRESELEAELQRLRQDLERLCIRVDAQEERIRALSEGNRSGSPSASTIIRSPSFDRPATGCDRPSGYTPYPWSQREQVARDIGQLITKCLHGEHRGSSGRDTLSRLQSQLYVVVRDFDNRVYRNPVRVCHQFSEVRELCQRSGFFGNSIFVGFPTEYEARIAVQVAALHWPRSDQQ